MPLLGWTLGSQSARYIQSVDHWVAFVLLALIGGNMIREAALTGGRRGGVRLLRGTGSPQALFEWRLPPALMRWQWGVTFAFLRVEIVPAVSIIGCTTFCLSVAGVAVGNFFGTRYQRRAELAGGMILVLLGSKILLEHLGLF